MMSVGCAQLSASEGLQDMDLDEVGQYFVVDSRVSYNVVDHRSQQPLFSPQYTYVDRCEV